VGRIGLAVLLVVMTAAGCSGGGDDEASGFCGRASNLLERGALDDELWLDLAGLPGLQDRLRSALGAFDDLAEDADGLAEEIDLARQALRDAIGALEPFGFDGLAAAASTDVDVREPVARLGSADLTAARRKIGATSAADCDLDAPVVGTAPAPAGGSDPVDPRAVDPATLDATELVDLLVRAVPESRLGPILQLTGTSSLAALRRAADEGRVEVDAALAQAASDLLAVDGPGDDAALDRLVERCQADDLAACDTLWFQAPIGSEYETIGATCGGRFPDGSRAYGCADEATDD
jgi:hypothetical protein